MPGSPDSNTTWPSPAFALDQRRSSNSSSSSRPTSSVSPLACKASKRLSTEAGRNAAQARTGPAMPLRSCAPRSSSSNRLPTSFRVLSAIDHAVRLRNALQACRKVRRLAYDCLLLRSARADQVADDHQTRRDADTRLQGRVGLQSAYSSRPTPALRARPALRRPRGLAGSRNRSGPRRPCTSRRNRRSAARSLRRTSGRPK